MTKVDAKKEALEKFYVGMRMEGKSRDTIKNYRGWVAQYIDFISSSTLPSRAERVSSFLSYLVIECDVAQSTQKQALNAIICFHRLRGEEVGKLNYRFSSKKERLPVILSREECWKTMDQLTGKDYIQAGLMWGCGLRVNEVCSLRVMDIDLDRMQVHIHEGKGAKDRKVTLPDLLKEPLEKYFRILRPVQEDYASRKIPVSLPGALDRKYPNAPFSWPWFWLFPAYGLPKDAEKWGKALWHIHKNAIQKRIGRAYKAARINKNVGCHSLRHAFATHWLENAEGNHEVAIIQLQKILGHSNPKTTMIYLHCVKQRTDVKSPLDVPLKMAA
jgi:integron integrase